MDTTEDDAKWRLFSGDRFYVLDGGFNSALCKYLPECADEALWGGGVTHTHPDLVKRVHREFLAAGSQVIATNTYQTSPELFRKHLAVDVVDAHLLYHKAVKLAREAAEEEGLEDVALVAGSVGPYGACLGDGSEYTGSYLDKVDAAELEQWHFERVKRLVEAGVDFLAVETIPSIVEAKAILNVVDRFPSATCWISFQCRDGAHTARGERFDDAVRQLIAHPASATRLLAVGVNCTRPRDVAPLLKLANAVNNWEAWSGRFFYRRLPYVVYPNSGEQYDAETKSWAPAESDYDCILNHVAEWMDLGANAIGGCCRTGPDDVSKIKEAVAVHVMDALQRRRENFVRDNRSDLEEKLKSLRRREPSSKRASKEEAAGGVKSLRDCLRTDFCSIPGHMTQAEIDAEVKAIAKALENVQ